MKESSDKELMIPERMQAAKQEPKQGELIQGIGFALLTAIDHFDSAEQLFKAGKKGAGYGLFINGLEELGKVNKLTNILVDIDKEGKASKYQKTQKSHSGKLQASFNLFSRILKLKSTEIKINNLFSYDGGEPPIDFILKKISPEAASKYHLLRQKCIYTNFDGTKFSSPYHFAAEIDNESYETLSMILRDAFKQIYSAGNKLLPVIFEIVYECYYCEDDKKIKILKSEINRRVPRVVPALRKVVNDSYIKEHGISIIELLNISRKKRPSTITVSADAFFDKVSSLVKGHEKIEKIYLFPPLKKWAKEFYSKFTK